MSFVCISDVDVIGALPLNLELFGFSLRSFEILKNLSFLW